MDTHHFAASLDFSLGWELSNKVRSIFYTPIHPSSVSAGLHLVISFGRAN
jgi:hypothetical protein